MRQKTGSPAFLLRTDNDIEYTAGHPIITHRTFRAIPPSSPATGYEAVLPSIWLSTDGRERARVIRGLSDSVLGSPRPPPTATSSCCYYLSRFTTFRPALAVALPGFDFLMWLFAPSICRRSPFRLCFTG